MKNLSSHFFHICLLILLGSSLIPAAAEMYKWTDANGNTIYSQTPPPEEFKQQSKTIAPLPPPTGGIKPRTSLEERMEALNKRLAEREQRDQEKQQAKEKQAKRLADCQNSQANLNKLNSHRRLTEVENGQATLMTIEQRMQKMQEMQTFLDENCR